jgi:hypothetical protein
MIRRNHPHVPDGEMVRAAYTLRAEDDDPDRDDKRARQPGCRALGRS